MAAAAARQRRRAQRARVPARRRRLRAARLLRLGHPHADVRPARRRWPALSATSTPRRSARPTRACLLTGRNHHSNGVGIIQEMATGFPGYNGMVPQGKRLPVRDAAGAGLRDARHRQVAPDAGQRIRVGRVEGALAAVPRVRALLRFHRRQDEPVGADAGARQPLHRSAAGAGRGLSPQRRPGRPARSSTSPTCARSRRTSRSSCTTASAPDTRRIMSSRSGSSAIAGNSTKAGTAGARRCSRANSRMGIVPPDTQLSPRPPWVKAWDTLSADAKRLYARQMEVYAAFLEQTDHHVGRVDRFPRAAGRTRQHAHHAGVGQRRLRRGRRARLVQREPVRQPRRADGRAEPRSTSTTGAASGRFPNYSWGWAWAGNTPLRRWKRYLHQGGMSDPLIVHWPKGIARARRGARPVRARRRHRADDPRGARPCRRRRC